MQRRGGRWLVIWGVLRRPLPQLLPRHARALAARNFSEALGRHARDLDAGDLPHLLSLATNPRIRDPQNSWQQDCNMENQDATSKMQIWGGATIASAVAAVGLPAGVAAVVGHTAVVVGAVSIAPAVAVGAPFVAFVSLAAGGAWLTVHYARRAQRWRRKARAGTEIIAAASQLVE